jgi:HlyD family secretion protein
LQNRKISLFKVSFFFENLLFLRFITILLTYNFINLDMAKTKSNRWLYIGGGITILLIILALVAKSKGWIGGVKETEVITAKAKMVSITEKVSASGKIQPEVEVKLASDVSGEIRELWIKEGDSVQKGQLLLKVRPDNYQSIVTRTSATLNSQKANLSQTTARLDQSKAQVERTKNEYERVQKLFAAKVASQSELEVAQANYTSAQADFNAAKETIESSKYVVQSAAASLKEAQENLALTMISAPMSGIVSRLVVKKGERVVGTVQMAGTEMLRIADLNVMEVRVDVNENDIIRVKIGDTAIVDVDAYSYTGKKFKGIVTAIANSAKESLTSSVTDGVTEFEVKIRILYQSYEDLLKKSKQVSPFRPGMTASVEVLTQRKDNILAVPLSAVTTRNPKLLDGDEKDKEGENPDNQQDNKENKKAEATNELKEVVFVMRNGEAKMIEVKTGISDFDNIEILSGLQDGDEVITAPFQAVSKQLKDGTKVKIKEADKKKKKTE